MKNELAAGCAKLNLGGVELEVIDLSDGRVPEPQTIKSPLATFSTKELHEELARRSGVEEHQIDVEGVATLQIGNEYIGTRKEISGPCRILINHD